MNDVVDDVGWILVGCWPRGLEAAALVDSDVYEDRTRLHPPHHVCRHQRWSTVTFDEHGADHEIRLQYQLFDRGTGRVHRFERVPEVSGETIEHGNAPVEHNHIAAEAGGHLDCVLSNNPAADHDHARGHHTRNATEQQPCTAIRRLEAVRAGLHRHAPGNL